MILYVCKDRDAVVGGEAFQARGCLIAIRSLASIQLVINFAGITGEGINYKISVNWSNITLLYIFVKPFLQSRATIAKTINDGGFISF